ncbi:MAG: rod shape-determining protein RodA [Gracilibacter sp. BRH_c7a]|nr:MAG: rod shape-determining protein RodA [Gracilibacter sp. BRH_c7a]
MLKNSDKKYFRGIDFILVITLLALLAASLIILSTASINLVKSDPYHYVKNQAIWILTGTFMMIIVAAIDYNIWKKLNWWIYGLNISLLLLVFVMGSTAKGAQRWLQITSSIGIQPSEFAKVFVILTFACFLADRRDKLNNVKDFLPPLLFVLPPTILIFLQPDLGTALVFGAIFIGMMFMAGANPIKFGSIILGTISVAITAIYFHVATNLPWPFKYLEGMPIPMKEYQLNRLLSFIDSTKDTSGDGYHVIQSVWAIGSGGLWGKGFREGTQSQLNFLPEHHTDFIFSVLGEEFGFIGTSILLFIFCIFIIRMIAIAAKAMNDFGMLIVSGVVTMLAFQILVNVGMSSGIMPITGLPLPFISAGGSSMWTNMLALGLVISVGIRGEKPMF